MKRLAFSFFAFVLALGVFFMPGTGHAATNNNSSVSSQTTAQAKVLNKLQNQTQGKKLKVSWDKKRGNPRYINGKLSKDPVKSNKAVETFLNDNRALFNLDAGTFKVNKVKKDHLGMTHYRTQLMVDSIPVYGSQWIVHTNKKGIIVSMNGQLEPNLAHVKWQKRVKVSKDDAIQTAKKALDFTPNTKTFTSTPQAKLYLYQQKNKWTPAYQVELHFMKPYPGWMITFVNAQNGKVVDSYNAIETSTGSGVGVLGGTKTLNTTQSNGTYYLVDQTKPMNNGDIETYSTNNSTSLPGSYVTDSDDNFNSNSEAPAVDAHYYAGVVYDYYHDVFGRNSYDNNGATIESTVHYGQAYNNAFWNGSQMVYGDGDGSTFIPLSGALDVVGHELTHAVTQTTANLTYQDQPGALNESMSDAFGVMIQAYNGDSNWLVGEDVYTPYTSGDALRSVKDPTKYNQPDNMADYVNTSSDNGGVHTNSGIPNKAFYNIASQLGFDETGAIYYRALTQYLTSQSNFQDARDALLQSASDLYGSTSTEYTTVDDGFAAVGIGSSSNPNPGTDTWYYESASADTPHPYPSYYDSGHQYTKAGADKVALHFSRLETENGYDFVYIKDKNGNVINQYTGSHSGFWAIVDGDQISSELVSDAYVNAYGYHIDEVAYYNAQPLLTKSTGQASLAKNEHAIQTGKKAKTTFKDPIQK